MVENNSQIENQNTNTNMDIEIEGNGLQEEYNRKNSVMDIEPPINVVSQVSNNNTVKRFDTDKNYKQFSNHFLISIAGDTNLGLRDRKIRRAVLSFDKFNHNFNYIFICFD